MLYDPSLILAQIVCLQCLYYLTLGAFSSFLVGSRASRMSLVYLFDFVTVTASTVTGWCAIAAFFLTSIADILEYFHKKNDSVKTRSVYMLYLIERAKKCLDFAATLYIIHLSICTIYGGWPSSVTWWVVNVTGFEMMALLGKYLCIRREMREIP
ncbi:hypothetical protein E1A91_A02G137600v1 [Gossypium mustelinum]|uniref:Uncharacterized protein n=1 Tax=Gossypium mustelinum TaxID=34275 RepID=A0A5D3AA24_GOSMU|nr:hypothetical protein E1A91_A02G137600v1 [Gossypium mustelinum]